MLVPLCYATFMPNVEFLVINLMKKILDIFSGSTYLKEDIGVENVPRVDIFSLFAYFLSTREWFHAEPTLDETVYWNMRWASRDRFCFFFGEFFSSSIQQLWHLFRLLLLKYMRCRFRNKFDKFWKQFWTVCWSNELVKMFWIWSMPSRVAARRGTSDLGMLVQC